MKQPMSLSELKAFAQAKYVAEAFSFFRFQMVHVNILQNATNHFH